MPQAEKSSENPFDFQWMFLLVKVRLRCELITSMESKVKLLTSC